LRADSAQRGWILLSRNPHLTFIKTAFISVVMLIRTIPDLQDAFGTYVEAAAVLGMTPQALNDARRRGNLPRQRYFTQKSLLEHHGHRTDPSLWGFSSQSEKAA
jgi:hypothetical protein